MPDNSCILTNLSRWERGITRSISRDYRRLLRMVYGLSDVELGIKPAEATAHAAAENTPRLHSDAASYYEILFGEHVRADNLMGPRPALEIVSRQMEILASAVRQARDIERPPLVRLACRYEEFLGWLNQDAGYLDQAMIHTDRARDLATEIDDPRLTAYLLMRKSNVASDASDPSLALSLAKAALRAAPGMIGSMRAVVLRQQAHALAGLGKDAECADVILEALDAVAGDRVELGEDSLAPYCTSSYVSMEAATCWLRLGMPDKAVDVFQETPINWPRDMRRDYGLHLARRALAHAGVGDVPTACIHASEATQNATVTASSRTVYELKQVAGSLRRWEHRPEVEAVLSLIAHLVAGITN
ncbi:MAG TPA: hypothetical protein VI248_10705 [Kineosporiaceae bacterium]